MLHAFRGRACQVARAFAILLLVGTAAPTALHGVGGDDPLCDPSVRGSASAHVQPQSGPERHTEHCAVCHWLRSLRGLDASPVASGPELPLDREVRPEAASSASRLDAPSIPARAPPA